MMLRHRLQHLPYRQPRPGRIAGALVGARQIDACVRKVRSGSDDALEQRNALGHFVLIEQRHSQQPQAIHLAGRLPLQSAQPGFRGRGATGT